MKFGLHRVSIWVNIQNKFQVPRSHSIGEKCDAQLAKFQSCLLGRIVQLWNFASYHRILLENCTTDEHEIWFSMRVSMHGLIYRKNFIFLGCTVLEKNAMLTCKISKLFIRTNCATLKFCKLSSHFAQKLYNGWTWNLVFYESIHAWVNIQKKFHFPRLHSIGEKCDANLQNSKLFIRTIVQLWNFAKLSSHFAWNCTMDEHEIWFSMRVSIKVNNYTKKISMFLSRTVLKKNAMHILQNFKVVH